MRRTAGSVVMALCVAVCGDTVAAQNACPSLSSVAVQGTINAVTLVAAGTFVPPGGASTGLNGFAGSGSVMYPKQLSAFCRVQGTLRPSADSEIAVEVWLPETSWNGKLLAVGNGGWAGTINYGALMEALTRGYATVATDTGHKGANGDGRFAFGHPEKVVDFAYRAIHEMTVTAKTIIASRYGRPASPSYFVGCSTGGKQALKEAQKYPADFEGIVAGAPANNWTTQMVQSLSTYQAANRTAAHALPVEKLSLLHSAVLAACDATDGVKDGLLSDPLNCHFDPKTLECRSGSDPAACLSPQQVETVQQAYEGLRLATSKERLFAGLAKGSELGWTRLVGPEPFPIPLDYFRYVVFKNPSWTPLHAPLVEMLAAANAADGGLINATDTNLAPFFGRGGKLLQFHGWNDQLIPSESSIDYYNSVVGAVGDRRLPDSYRLFMAPGLNHCSGGDGLNAFDTLGALEQWVEKGRAPTSLIASHAIEGKVDRTRPLCPYPQVAKYTGTGSIDDAKNFACAAP